MKKGRPYRTNAGRDRNPFYDKIGVSIMTTLREKMKNEMNLIGLAQSTQELYLKAINKLYEYYAKSPAKLSITEIQNYLLHLKKRR